MLEQLDVSTLFFSNALLRVGTTFALLLLWWSHRRSVRGLGYLCLGAGLPLFGAFLFSMRGSWSPILTLALANGLIGLAGLAQIHGVRRFAGLAGARPLDLGLGLAALLAFVWFATVQPFYPARVGLISAWILLAHLRSLEALAHLLRPGLRGAVTLAMVGQLLAIASHTWRISSLDTVPDLPGSAASLGSDPSLSVLLVLTLVSTTLATLGVALLVSALVAEDLATAHARLKHQAAHDPLTRVLNRRGFSEQAEHTLRSGLPCTVLLLDIDHFKRVNDTYGHDAGDEVLVQVAACLRRTVRSQDLVGRLGGEEFAVLLSATEPHAALQIAERCRAAIAAESIDQIQGATLAFPLSVTASIGVAEAVGSLEAALSAADEAMYEAKRSGRDRVCRHGPEAGSLAA